MSEFDRAVAEHRAGHFEVAAKIYQRILAQDPEHADAWHLLGLTLHQRGENALAVQTIRRALLLSPRVGNYHNSLGLALHATGNNDEALRSLQTAALLAPEDADVQNNLGMVLTALRRFDEAERALRKSLKIRPDDQGALYNLGRVLVWRGDYETAPDLLREACALDPLNPTYWNMFGVALAHVHQFSASRDAFERAISIDPERIDPHIGLAHSLLQDGLQDRGWAEHEWRLRRPEFAHRMKKAPWRGEDITGRTILLWTEQGMGDAIQFVRYASLVADRGARVIVACPDVLQDLFRTVRGVDEVVERNAHPAHDAHAALMSLPSVFGIVSDQIPYFEVPSSPIAAETERRRVGLVWAGNPAHANDRNRSHLLQSFAPLASVNADFFSLQMGDAAQEAAPDGMALRRLGGQFENFADTGAVLSALDLLITVDTSVAHLAGALGVPTWMILPSNPDWRWGREGQMTDWYPGMRLFRQAPGEANEQVFERLAKALAVE